jgi:hypothetical protein
MATHLENFINILTGVLGTAPDNNQLSTVASAALTKVSDKEIEEFFPNITRETLTVNQRAYIANVVIRKLIRRMVRTVKVADARVSNQPAVIAAANDETI